MFPVSIPYFFPDFHSKEKTYCTRLAEFTSLLEFIHKHMSPAKITKLLPNDCHYPQKHPFLKYASNTAAGGERPDSSAGDAGMVPLTSRETAKGGEQRTQLASLKQVSAVLQRSHPRAKRKPDPRIKALPSGNSPLWDGGAKRVGV